MARASCVFCEIVAGRAPAHVLMDDLVAFAFLDARPVFDGHALVVPRHHVETLLDLEPDQVGPFFQRVQRVARAVEQGLGADGTLVLMNNRVSQSVPHLHAHVVPRRKKDGLRGFLWPRHPYASDAEARSFAERIRASLASG